jgi:hypothetical protein
LKPQAATGHRKFIIKDLPAGSDRGNAWSRTYIPTYISFVAAYKDPWSVEDKHAIDTMQEAWNCVYINDKAVTDKIPHTVAANQAVFAIVRYFPRPLLITALFLSTPFVDESTCL